MRRALTIYIMTCLLVSCQDKPTRAHSAQQKGEKLEITEKIAYANGLGEFEKLEELNYTFNVSRNDSLVTSRSWSWKPQVDSVSYTEKDRSVSYNTTKDSARYPDIDQKFINDQYWLLFPFHLVWDEMKFEHLKDTVAPISGKSLDMLTVTYPDDVGYTPGDVYEIYFDDDYIIQEWVYKPGGSQEKAFAATWEEYIELNGMKLATRHRNKNGSFQIFFTDINASQNASDTLDPGTENTTTPALKKN